MPEALRITADQFKKRMESGEDFTLLDTRNPQAWAESDTMATGALRVPLDELDGSLSRIPKGKSVVAYCT